MVERTTRQDMNLGLIKGLQEKVEEKIYTVLLVI